MVEGIDGDYGVSCLPQYFVNEGPGGAPFVGWALVGVMGSVITLLVARRLDNAVVIPAGMSYQLTVSLTDRSLDGSP